MSHSLTGDRDFTNSHRERSILWAGLSPMAGKGLCFPIQEGVLPGQGLCRNFREITRYITWQNLFQILETWGLTLALLGRECTAQPVSPSSQPRREGHLGHSSGGAEGTCD